MQHAYFKILATFLLIITTHRTQCSPTPEDVTQLAPRVITLEDKKRYTSCLTEALVEIKQLKGRANEQDIKIEQLTQENQRLQTKFIKFHRSLEAFKKTGDENFGRVQKDMTAVLTMLDPKQQSIIMQNFSAELPQTAVPVQPNVLPVGPAQHKKRATSPITFDATSSSSKKLCVEPDYHPLLGLPLGDSSEWQQPLSPKSANDLLKALRTDLPTTKE